MNHSERPEFKGFAAPKNGMTNKPSSSISLSGPRKSEQEEGALYLWHKRTMTLGDGSGNSLQLEVDLPTLQTIWEGLFVSGPETIDKASFKVEAYGSISELSNEQIKTVMACINSLTFHAAADYGAIAAHEQKTGAKRYTVKRDKMQQLLKTMFAMRLATEAIVKGIERWWKGCKVNKSRGKVVEALNLLRWNGLVDWVDQSFVKGEWGRQRLYTFVDIPRLLLLAELCEDVLKSRVGDAALFEHLPKHKCSMLKTLYDAVFTGWGYRRKGAPDTQEPKTWEETDTVRSQWKAEWEFGQDRLFEQCYSHARGLISSGVSADDPGLMFELKKMAEDIRGNAHRFIKWLSLSRQCNPDFEASIAEF